MHTKPPVDQPALSPQPAGRRIHPLVASAAVSVTVLSLAGVAAVTGLISTPFARNAPPTSPVAQTSAPAAAPVAPAAAQFAAAAAPGTGPDATPDAATQRGNASATALAVAQASRDAASRREAMAKHAQASRPVRPPAAPVAPVAPVATAPAVDPSVATVLAVERVEEKPDGSGVGVVGGGVVGGVLGNQVGGGNGKKAMTVLGAIGGAVAGNAIEKKVRSVIRYDVTVRLADGSTRVLRYPEQPSFGAGDRIRIDPSRAS